MLIITSSAFLVIFGLGILYRRQQLLRSRFSTDFIEKYDALYRSLTNKRSAEIVKSSASRIVVKVNVNSDVHYFGLEEIDSRLLITWKLNSSEFGKTSREWSFNPNSPQQWMYEEVLGDIREFQLNQIKQKRNSVTPDELQVEAHPAKNFNLA